MVVQQHLLQTCAGTVTGNHLHKTRSAISVLENPIGDLRRIGASGLNIFESTMLVPTQFKQGKSELQISVSVVMFHNNENTKKDALGQVGIFAQMSSSLIKRNM